MEDPQVIQQADEFIAFLVNVQRFKLRLDIALIVDNQVCDSTFEINTRTEKGQMVLERLLETAVGARLGLYTALKEPKGTQPMPGLYFGP